MLLCIQYVFQTCFYNLFEIDDNFSQHKNITNKLQISHDCISHKNKRVLNICKQCKFTYAVSNKIDQSGNVIQKYEFFLFSQSSIEWVHHVQRNGSPSNFHQSEVLTTSENLDISDYSSANTSNRYIPCTEVNMRNVNRPCCAFN